MKPNFTPDDIEIGVKYKHPDWIDCIYIGILEELHNKKYLLIIECSDKDCLWKTVLYGEIDSGPTESDTEFWNKFYKI